jgi:hypothetical protein
MTAISRLKPKPVKKAKKSAKSKALAKTKALVGIVTVNDLSPI